MNRDIRSFALAKTTCFRLVLAGLIAVPAASAMAQSASAEKSASMPGMHRNHHDPANMQMHFEKRQAELKGKLKLTPEQEPAWSAFSTAMKPLTRPMRPAPEQRSDLQNLQTPERIDRMRAEHSQRMAEMTKLMDQRGEAAKTFYGALTSEQKKIFDAEAFRNGRAPGGRYQHG